jgi:hypothetical protein
MTIILEAHYAKKVPLAPYCSHTYALTVRTEIGAQDDLAAESQRLHALLQAAVDRELQIEGFVPESRKATDSHGINGTNGHSAAESDPTANGWQCSGRQRELILTIAEERQMRLGEVELLARERFGKELSQLSRRQASDIISRLRTA